MFLLLLLLLKLTFNSLVNLRAGYSEMTKFLNGLPVYGLGRKFLIVTKKALVENFIKAVSYADSIYC